MVDITQFTRRLRKFKTLAFSLFFGGAAMLAIDFTTAFPTAEKGEFAMIWVVMMALGGVFYFRSLELPAKEIIQLAESHNGLLTVSEITTALDIHPDLTLRTLRHLQATGITSPRWQEIQKNLWEFPDSLKLPISETLEIARKNNGRISLQDLIAQGHTIDVARQTLDTLAEKGLAKQDPASDAPAMILQSE